MLQTLPAATLVPPTPTFPERRFVWHVSANVPYGTSRLILNVFEGSRAVAYDQEDIGSVPAKAVILAAIESMTRRLNAASPPHPKRRGRLLFVNKKKQKNFANLGRAGCNATGPKEQKFFAPLFFKKAAT